MDNEARPHIGVVCTQEVWEELQADVFEGVPVFIYQEPHPDDLPWMFVDMRHLAKFPNAS